MTNNEKNEKPDATAPSRSLRRKLAPLLIVLATAGAVLLVATVLPETSRDKPATAPPPVNVKVLPVEQRSFDDTLRLHGLVEPNRVVTLSAEVPGRVEQILAQEGQPVATGSVILRLNDELIRPDRDRAKATLEYWQKDYARIQTSYNQGVATNKDRDQALMNLATARADHAAAQARLDRTVIRSPIAGVLDTLHVEKGQSVRVGEPLADIVEIDPLVVVVDVPERDVPYVCQKRDQQVRISLKKPLPTSVFGKIKRISERADPQTRTTRVEIELSNPLVAGGDGRLVRRLRSGPIAMVELTRRELRDAILIPLQAVIPLEEGYAVYVVVNGQAQRRKVELGLMKGTHVRIVASGNPGQGLTEGDLLIVSGHHYVAPGQAVKIVETQEPPAPQTQPADAASEGEAQP